MISFLSCWNYFKLDQNKQRNNKSQLYTRNTFSVGVGKAYSIVNTMSFILIRSLRNEKSNDAENFNYLSIMSFEVSALFAHRDDDDDEYDGYEVLRKQLFKMFHIRTAKKAYH